MDMRDLFLAQHSAVHTAAVGGNKASAAERVLNGLSDEQMRVRPREDLNSIAWLVWHIARAEDIFLNPVFAGRAQVFDDAWMKRLGVARKDFGIGMKSPEVSDLTRSMNIDALREYRDAVGKLLTKVLELQYQGDKDAADQFIQRYTAWDENLHGAIARKLRDTALYRYWMFDYEVLTH